MFDHTLLLTTHQILFWFLLATLVILGKPENKYGIKLLSYKNNKQVFTCSILILIILTWGYYKKLSFKHPEKYEYGYFTPYQKIKNQTMRWIMRRSCTEVLATSDQFGFSIYAEPENLSSNILEMKIFANDNLIDQLIWEKKETKHKYYHINGLKDKNMKIKITTNNSYNPYKSGVSKNIRETRDQSAAITDITFFNVLEN